MYNSFYGFEFEIVGRFKFKSKIAGSTAVLIVNDVLHHKH